MNDLTVTGELPEEVKKHYDMMLLHKHVPVIEDGKIVWKYVKLRETV